MLPASGVVICDGPSAPPGFTPAKKKQKNPDEKKRVHAHRVTVANVQEKETK